MTPTLVGTPDIQRADTATNTTLTSGSLTVQDGDIIVLKTVTAYTDCSPVAPTAGGAAMKRQATGPAAMCDLSIYTWIVTGNPGTITVVVPYGAGTEIHNQVVEVWRGGQLAAAPATNAVENWAAGTGFSASLTTGYDNSVITWCAGDSNAQPFGTIGYQSSATTDGATSNFSFSYYAYQAAATAGAQTFGTTTPASSLFDAIGIEIVDAAVVFPPAIALREAAASTLVAAAVTAINPVVPASATTGDLSVLWVEAKPYNTAITTPSGWTKIGEATNGVVATGIDVGSTIIACYVKESATPGTIGNLTLTSANTACAQITTYSKPATYTWDYTAWTSGGTSQAANYAATGAAGLNVATDDWVACGTGVNSDLGTTAITAQTIAGMSGATLSGAVRIGGTATGDGLVTTGNDSRLIVVDADVTAGSSNAAPTMAYTLANTTSGTSLWLRLRMVAPAYPFGLTTPTPRYR